jgi:hypothetical protein
MHNELQISDTAFEDDYDEDDFEKESKSMKITSDLYKTSLSSKNIENDYDFEFEETEENNDKNLKSINREKKNSLRKIKSSNSYDEYSDEEFLDDADPT